MQCSIIHFALVHNGCRGSPVTARTVELLKINSHKERLTLISVMGLDLIRIIGIWLDTYPEVPVVSSVCILGQARIDAC